MNETTSRVYDEKFPDLKKILHRIIELKEYSFEFREEFYPEKKAILFPLRNWTIHKIDVLEFSPIVEKKSELLKIIKILQSCLYDPTERHIQYFRFKEELRGMRDIIDQRYWDLLRLVIGCIDATTNTPAVDLNYSKVEAFKKVIQQIKVNIDCSSVNSLLETLISAGLKPVPDLQNLEPIGI
jgi:hypothetical protein